MQIRTVPFVQQLRRASFSSSSSPSAKPAAEKFLQVGTALRLSRRFSGADVKAYSDLTGDANPLHSDPDFASRISGFLAPVVHGLLVASLFPRIIASQFVSLIFEKSHLHYFSLSLHMALSLISSTARSRLRFSETGFQVAGVR